MATQDWAEREGMRRRIAIGTDDRMSVPFKSVLSRSWLRSESQRAIRERPIHLGEAPAAPAQPVTDLALIFVMSDNWASASAGGN